MKYGVRLSINVSKIKKEHLFKGKNGIYLDATVFLNPDEKDQYDNNGMITQSWKDQAKNEGPILGNAQVFWSDGQQSVPQRSQPTQQATGSDFEEDQIPF